MRSKNITGRVVNNFQTPNSYFDVLLLEERQFFIYEQDLELKQKSTVIPQFYSNNPLWFLIVYSKVQTHKNQDETYVRVCL